MAIGHDGGGGGAACMDTVIVSTAKVSMLLVYKNTYRAVPAHETMCSCPLTVVPGT